MCKAGLIWFCIGIGLMILKRHYFDKMSIWHENATLQEVKKRGTAMEHWARISDQAV